MSSSSVLRDVLTWSKGRAYWQRDALRRIVVNGSLDEHDIEELLQMCLGAHAVADGTGRAPEPFAEPDLAKPSGDSESVSLMAIADVQNVNALAPNAELTFTPTGLNVVYGPNGSGKSGFVRVLRSCCRARAGMADVLCNVFGVSPQGEQSATIHYQRGTTTASAPWKAGQPSSPELSAISVFDAACASLYVTDNNELAFMPLGLDVFDKLAYACSAVREGVDERVAATECERPVTLAAPPVQPITEVGKLLATLSGATPEAHVRELAKLSREESDRLSQLERALRDDPLQSAARIRLVQRRAAHLRDRLTTLVPQLSEESAARLATLQTEAASKRRGAELAAKQGSEQDPLTGVGGEDWRALWEAARRYSEVSAYPDSVFPAVGKDDRCVLCQQVLGADASERLTRFERFVQADTERQAVAAEAAFQESRLTLTNLTVRSANDEEALEEIAGQLPVLAQQLAAFVGSADARLTALRQACDDGDWNQVSPLPPSPIPDLEAFIARAGEDASRLEAAAADNTRAAILLEFQELADRRWLSGVVEDVLAEIARLSRKEGLQSALTDTDTRRLTRKSTELSEQVITEELCRAFVTELSSLSRPPIQVEIAPAAGKHGVPHHRIRLAQAPGVAVADVASEGEHRCIALATFLAELATASDHSAIVLDDPVCSLDHLHRRHVAERLSREARQRQVIVFTHDLAFLAHLRRASDELGVGCAITSVETVPARGHGVCDPDIPWEGTKVNARIGRLKNLSQKAGALRRADRADDYEALVIRIYTRLRQTWERAVEEVLLGGVVERFDSAVQTKRVEQVTDLRDSDYPPLEMGVGRCSRILHDQPDHDYEPVPEPDAIDEDITSLEQWVNDIRERRKKR